MAVIIPVASKFDDKGIKKAKSAFAGLGNTLKSTIGALGIATSFAGVAAALKDATKAASDDNKAQILLAQQLRNTTNATDAQIAAVEESISQMSMQTAVADDKLRPALASLVRATGDVTQAQDLLALSLDVSAATGKDLNAVSLAIGKAVSGQTSQLFRMVPALKDSGDWMAKLTANTKGMAIAAGNADPFMRLKIIFDELQESIGFALLPSLQEFANWLGSPATQNAIKFMIDGFNGWVASMKNTVDGANMVGQALANVLNINPNVAGKAWNGFFNGLGSSVATLVGGPAGKILLTLLNLLGGGSKKDTAFKPVAFTPTDFTGTTFGTAPGGKAPKKANPVADYYAKIADDVKKQKALTALQAKGLSKSFAESIIGSGADWAKLYKDVLSKNASGLAALQAQFRNTAAGYQEALDIAQAAFDAEMEAWQGRKDAYDGQVEAIDNFKSSMKGILTSLKPLAVATREIGEFEQASIQAFDSIAQALDEGLANGTLTQAAANNLRNYANAESALLNKLAQNRDELAKKRGLAEALISDVKGAILGLGNLSGLVSNETRKITTTVTKLVGGVSVATRSTIEETIGASGYLDRLKDIVSKTKTFAKQLTELKALGLNKNLFAQIVEAGPTVGGELANEILKGGTESVIALNDTFTELETVAASVAEQTAVVMYGAGVDVTNGLVNGLLAEEQKLVAAAQTLADAFTNTFNARMNSLIMPTMPNPGPAPVFVAPPVFVPAPVVPKTTAAPKASTVINVNVKANKTNTKATGQAVVAAVNKFLTSSKTGAAIASGRFVV